MSYKGANRVNKLALLTAAKEFPELLGSMGHTAGPDGLRCHPLELCALEDRWIKHVKGVLLVVFHKILGLLSVGEFSDTLGVNVQLYMDSKLFASRMGLEPNARINARSKSNKRSRHS